MTIVHYRNVRMQSIPKMHELKVNWGDISINLIIIGIIITLLIVQLFIPWALKV